MIERGRLWTERSPLSSPAPVPYEQFVPRSNDARVRSANERDAGSDPAMVRSPRRNAAVA